MTATAADCIRIVGGRRLAGEIIASGAKNAALPCMFATLLTDQQSRLDNLPAVDDVDTTRQVLDCLGVATTATGGGLLFQPGAQGSAAEIPVELARSMRASILALGPLLARHGHARVPLPGGCDFGTRPIDIHLRGLEAMGAQIAMRGGVLEAKARRLRGTRLTLDFPSFTGTENLLMAASLAQGCTVIDNAAREPEVGDLARMLVRMGARIDGIDSATLTIDGVDSLAGAEHSVMGDRIEAGTFLMAAAATQGQVSVTGIDPSILAVPLDKLAEAGAAISSAERAISIETANRLKAISVDTAPYPGFPTDLQAQTLALNCLADGTALVTEHIWPQRFRTADELALLGAEISVHGNCATVVGQPRLAGAHVQATDLRASAALVIAGLAASGETWIHDIHHLQRGYADLPGKLRGIGADVRTMRAPV